jgi:hypothetical protein
MLVISVPWLSQVGNANFVLATVPTCDASKRKNKIFVEQHQTLASHHAITHHGVTHALRLPCRAVLPYLVYTKGMGVRKILQAAANTTAHEHIVN